ncbi:probable ATP-dependent DNA helicase HFM1 [Nymphalis io]|uniref:probable ATP-dependent DNA helicase HFM1 n=1 Tax=Inachis io TaxID=171585 RepID=UPI0021691C3F|nr:probable ATP-dependent DNA helicase HFM1 [Nymphalis io]
MVDHISKFTDILDDEMECSQPLSLPSSNNSDIQEISGLVQNRPPKNTGQEGNFRSIEEIELKYRHVFAYPYFNLVQSKVIEDALYTDKSMVVCAPTGSGKTVIFEMAIVHLLMELQDKNYADDFKIIYMAPVKALCTERLSEWYPKFNKLGLLCIEVTGDTDVEFPQLKPYRIIITTPEKWDMLTRRWKDHRSLVEVIKLFLIDEVHILNDEIRGPVLEAVVSRMKTIEASAQSAHRIEKLKAQYQGTNSISSVSAANIRFVAISATVSNPDDVATWLGTADRQAVYYKFGDECRPVKLKRIVEGYPCADGTSIFKFDIVLNYKLWPIIQKYHNGKPTLIFCNTRKSVVLTAETLAKEITVSFNTEQKMKLTSLASTIKTKKIQSLILCGVGCHHAGLLFEERMNIEHAFRNRDLPILITTTTLAMGVNLPAHLVIIKNTQQYVNGAYQEYSISTILQMVGRAGRPQYDTEATAVIMTRLQDKARYQALVGGSEPLQSYLHKRLAENLNSEAALGTVGDVAQCVQWLNSTFLSVRAARDPRRYLGLPQAAPAHQISKKIEELCVKAMNGLASAGLITMDEASCIESTEAGRLMSVYYLDLGTMKLIMKLEGTESLERLLWLVCESQELSDMHLRVDERRCLNALNRNNAAATIRFPMKGKINSRQMKLNCIIQAVLGCLPIPDPSLNQEATKIMRIADRVCKCLVSYVTRSNLISQNPKFFATILNSLILAKCISVHLWENSPYVSRQLKGIGPTFSALLASAGKVTFMLLEESHPRDLERIMNKGPPAGNILRKQINLLPKYNLTTTPINENTVQIQLSLLNHALLAENIEHLTAGASHKSYIIVGDSDNNLLYFTYFKDSDLINIYNGCMTFKINRKHNSKHKISVHCISSSFVGMDEQCQFLFKDLYHIPANNESSQYSAAIPLTNPNKQAIPNIQKERKRKSPHYNEITQSKEKKKRENYLLEKFKSLKKSLGKTSSEINENDHKSAQISNNILQNLTKSENYDFLNFRTSNESNDTNLILSNDIQNAFQIDFEYDDSVDDKQVNDILNVIENEMETGESTINATISSTSTHVRRHDQKSNHNPNKSTPTMTLNISKEKSEIEKLEKKLDLNDEDETPETVNETGFNNSVKHQIEQYLIETANKKSEKANVIDILSPIIDDQEHNRFITKNTEEYKTTTDFLNKGETGSQNQSLLHENDNKLNTNINSIAVEANKNYSNILLSKKELIGNENTNYINENKSIQSYKKENNTCDIDTEGSLLSNTLLMNLPIIKNNCSITSNYSNEFQIINQPLSTMSNTNPIKQFTLLSKNNYLMPSSADDDSYEINIDADKNSKERKNSEYTRKHSLSKAHFIDTTITNKFNEKVHLIGKLEINLDVTEIVYSSDSNSNLNTKAIEDSKCTSSFDVIQNKDIPKNDKKDDLIVDTCARNYNDPDNNHCDFQNQKEGIKTSEENLLLKTSSTNVKDILKKYNNLVKRRHKNNIESEQAIPSENIKDNFSCADNATVKLKRKFRISDLDKINVDLPKYLIGESQTNVPFETGGNMESQNIDIRNIEQVNPDIINGNIQSNISDTEDGIFDIGGNMSPRYKIEEETKSNSELDVAEAILNPKMLLQCISKDVTNDIIPPPPEFCDDDTSQPTPPYVLRDNLNMEYDLIDSHDNKYDDHIDNICSENYEADLTPSKEIETWTLTQNAKPSYKARDPNIATINSSDIFTLNT